MEGAKMAERELAEDVAYVRGLAEEGRRAPLIGGPFLVFFGLLLCLAYLLHWALLVDLFGPLHGIWFAALWSGFGLLAGIGMILLSKRTSARPGASSIVNRVDGAVWQGVVFAIVATLIGCIGRAVAEGEPDAVNSIMAAGFGLYGVALGATAVISEQMWLRTFSLLAFATSWLLWMFGNENWAYLYASAATLVVLVAPGAVMMRRETRVHA
jgi:hypothetical protein